MYRIELSPQARSFYNEWALAPNDIKYNLSINQRLYGRLSVDRLHNALERYINEHVVLNSHVHNIDGKLFWVKNENISTLSYTNKKLSHAKLLNYVAQPFDLHKGPLYRFKLLHEDENIYRFILVFHHIVIDGMSMEKGIFEEISHYYNQRKYVANDSIDDQVHHLTRLSKKLSKTLKNHEAQCKTFWHEQIKGVDSVDLTFLRQQDDGRHRQALQKQQITNEVKLDYEKDTLAQLEKVKNHYQLSPYKFGLGVFALLLYKCTGQESFIVSYPISIAEACHLIYGAQVNTNLLPFCFTEEMTIRELFHQITDFFNITLKGEIKYAYYPIGNIFQESDGNKQLLNTSYSQTCFRYQPFTFSGITNVDALPDLNVDGVSQETILFEQESLTDTLHYRLRYNKRFFDKRLVAQLLESYNKLFLEILNDLSCHEIEKKLANYALVDKKNYQKIFKALNPYTVKCKTNKTVHETYEEQVLKTPNNVALVYQGNRLTYQVVNQKANQLAHYLRSQYAIVPNDIIALYLDRSDTMIITMMAVLKAGGAYLPIEVHTPNERIKYLLKDSQAKFLLTNQHYQENLGFVLHEMYQEDEHVFDSTNLAMFMVVIDDPIIKAKLATQSKANLNKITKNYHLLYILYTSGTTGIPKGVLQNHQNIVSLFNTTWKIWKFTSNDIWLLFHSYAFDISVWEIWGALFYGGALVIPTKEQVWDMDLLYELCYRERVTVFNQTASALCYFIEIAVKNFRFFPLSNLRYLMFGGDTLRLKNLKPWITLYGYDKPKLINLYGITETTLLSVFHHVTEKNDTLSIPIGIAIPDQILYVLDKYKSPVPAGVVGELYIGGARLSQGYLNNSKLTKERFITNPFQSEMEKKFNTNNRLYNTGDLVRMLPSGELIFIGRNDFQIKIRGYRIELNAIETILIKYPHVKQALVVVNENITNSMGEKSLIAYYVADRRLNEKELKHFLLTQLPAYMVPHYFVHLEQFPINVNGKIDRKVLPEPTLPQEPTAYESPVDSEGRNICAAFAKILGINNVSMTDDFFDLGGDSLKAISLTLMLQSHFDIKVADIFDLRTPKALAKSLSSGKNILEQKLEQVKLAYKNNFFELPNNKSNDSLLQDYLKEVHSINISSNQRKPISCVLLTGSAGFLGCNLLNQLLRFTTYHIILLVRANSQQAAIERIHHKFFYYFNKPLLPHHHLRVTIVNGDLESSDLGLSTQAYQMLVDKVDSIIHAAALVKHYGDSTQFYAANVQATVNLLELCQKTRLKDFHYISTLSVLNFGHEVEDTHAIYTEDSIPNDLNKYYNVYTKTKLQGEWEVINYRTQDVKTNIYRMGNLAFMSTNHQTQENIDDNAFAHWLKCLATMKQVGEAINQIEISPVDTSANAIVTLFDKQALTNTIFHLANPHKFDIAAAFQEINHMSLTVTTMDSFIDCLIEHLGKSCYNDLVVRFLAHQAWLETSRIRNISSSNILQHRTLAILKSLGFEWQPIKNKGFGRYLQKLVTI